MPRIMHLLNSFGHVSIHWQAQNDDKILPAIQIMLDQGYKFFIVADDSTEQEVTSVTEVATARRVSLSDAMLQQLHDAGLLQIGGVDIGEEAETTGETAKTVEAVVANETVVVQPVKGG